MLSEISANWVSLTEITLEKQPILWLCSPQERRQAPLVAAEDARGNAYICVVPSTLLPARTRVYFTLLRVQWRVKTFQD